MSSALIHPDPGPTPEPVFRLSVEQYHAMINAGVLTDDDPVELLEGVLVFKMPKNPKHRIAPAKLHRAIVALLPKGMSIQLQEPITLSDGEPEPDAVVFKGLADDYPDRHPGPSDVRLVVEVSDSTLARDRGIKLRSYARAGIREYWIVDLTSRRVEVYTNPAAEASPPTYAPPRVFSEGESIQLEIDGKVHGQFAVAEILP